MNISRNQLLNASALMMLVASITTIDAQSSKSLCCENKAIAKSLDLLYDAYLVTDKGFNEKGGLSPEEIAALGYYNETSISFAHGPSTANVCGHNLLPGTIAAQGTLPCATLQFKFEGALLSDPRFPYTTLADAPKIEHLRPILSHCWGDIFNVNSFVNVTYQGALVAVLQAVAQYKVIRNCKGKIVVPALAWIHFAIEYLDCPETAKKAK